MNKDQHTSKNDRADNSIPGFVDIPSGYFEELKTSLLHQLEEKASSTNKPSIYQRVWKAAAFLLILVGLATVLYLWTKPGKQHNFSQMALSQSHTETDTLKEQKIMAIDSLTFGQHLSVEQDSVWLDQLSDDDIILYLIESEEFEF